MLSLGMDLAGKDTNETGFCVIEFTGKDIKVTTKSLLDDREILRETEKTNPDIIAIDAPLSLPSSGYYRDSDSLLRQRGFNALSPMLPGMKTLALRGIMLSKILSQNHKVIEVFPLATEKALGLSKDRVANAHEYDALLCALTGKKFLENSYEDLAGIILPR